MKKSISIEYELVDRWLIAKEALKLAKEMKETAESKMIAALDDAEVGECPEGILKYKKQTRKAYEVAESKYRVLRWKENKNV